MLQAEARIQPHKAYESSPFESEFSAYHRSNQFAIPTITRRKPRPFMITRIGQTFLYVFKKVRTRIAPAEQ
jgi:hypothetical protein